MSEYRRNPKPKADETLQRVRRIETRMTQLMVGLGVPTHAQKPKFSPGVNGQPAHVELPSPHSSVKEALDAIPAGWPELVKVVIGGDVIGEISPMH